MDDPATADCERVLDADGTPVSEVPDMDRDTLRRFHRVMVRTRLYEDRVMAMRADGDIMLETGTTGEEATPLGAAAALAPGDWLFPSYRQRPAFFYWDWPMDRMLAERRGASRQDMDAALGKAGTDVEIVPVAVTVGTNVPQAVGASMSTAAQEQGAVSMAFIGDGTTSEGVVHEALNVAGVVDAPTVFICQNNQWSKSVPADRQTAADTFAQKGEAHGIPSRRVDGNDVLAVHRAARDAVDQARSGGGPTFIECLTVRGGPHNTEDDDAYREGTGEWPDPVDRFETYLLERGVLDEEDVAAVRDAVADEVDAAIARGMQVDVPPEPESVFAHHLSTEHWHHRRQRAELDAEQDGDNPFEVGRDG